MEDDISQEDKWPGYPKPYCGKWKGSVRLFLPPYGSDVEPTDKWYRGCEEIPELGIVAYIDGG